MDFRRLKWREGKGVRLPLILSPVCKWATFRAGLSDSSSFMREGPACSLILKVTNKCPSLLLSQEKI